MYLYLLEVIRAGFKKAWDVCRDISIIIAEERIPNGLIGMFKW